MRNRPFGRRRDVCRVGPSCSNRCSLRSPSITCAVLPQRPGRAAVEDNPRGSHPLGYWQSFSRRCGPVVLARVTENGGTMAADKLAAFCGIGMW
jgi:hypothetical protein